MKAQSLVLLVFATCLVLAACQKDKKVTVSVPTSASETQKALNKLNVQLGMTPLCDQPESSLKMTDEERAHKVNFEHKVDIRDEEYVDCDGHVEMKRKASTQPFTKFINVEEPETLRDAVEHIEIENLRNCHTSLARAVKDEILEQVFKIANQGSRVAMTTTVGESGFTKLVVASPGTIAIGKTSLSEGLNKIRIRYFGPCLEFNQTCKRSQLLAEKNVIVEVHSKRTTSLGFRQVATCGADKK